MKQGMKRSKGRAVSSRSAKGKRPAAAKAVRRPKAKSAKPKRKVTPAKPKRKATPARPKPKAVAAAAKGPSATVQRRIEALEEQLRARAQDGVEVVRWKQYHSQLQEQVKAKDSMLAFKDKELLDLRRQCEELMTQAKKKDT
ncbi:MAG: hypothetical protein HY574_10305 [candidate division NC10 bacterium]|nr:hypothetical protein [candidate division NC10 bacterium]